MKSSSTMQMQVTTLLTDALTAYMSSSDEESDGAEEVERRDTNENGKRKKAEASPRHGVLASVERKMPQKRLPSFASVMTEGPRSLGKRKASAASANTGPAVTDRNRKVAKMALVTQKPGENTANRRVRAFGHVDGSWASHVFIQMESDDSESGSPAAQLAKEKGGEGDGEDESERNTQNHIAGPWLHRHIASLVATLSEKSGVQLMPMSIRDSMGKEQEGNFASHLHVSLSRTFQLRYHILEPLEKALRAEVSSIPMFMIDIPISLNNVVLLRSDTKRVAAKDTAVSMATTFVGLRVSDVAGGEELNLLVNAVDSVLARFNCLPYYASRVFHCSIAWTSGDERKTLQLTLDQHNQAKEQGKGKLEITYSIQHGENNDCPGNKDAYLSMEVAFIFLRMGNRLIRLPLMK